MVANFSEDCEHLQQIFMWCPTVCAVLGFLFTWIAEKFFANNLEDNYKQ